MSERICEGLMCDKPSGDGIICRECHGKMRRLLAEIPALFDELDTAMRKEAKFAPQGDKISNRNTHPPMPLDVTAMEARDVLESKLTLWADDLARDSEVSHRAALSPLWASSWLLANAERIRTFEPAGDMWDELSSARATAVYVIDRPMERRYLGECHYEHVDEDGTTYPVCGSTLWGREGEDELTCKDCGTWYLVGILEQKIGNAATKDREDRIYTATEAAEVIVALRLGQDDAAKIVNKISQWALRKRLTRKIDLEKNGHKRPGYRLGDILDLLGESKADRKAS